MSNVCPSSPDLKLDHMLMPVPTTAEDCIRAALSPRGQAKGAATGPTNGATVDSGRPPTPPASPTGTGGSELIHNVIEVFDGRILDDRET